MIARIDTKVKKALRETIRKSWRGPAVVPCEVSGPPTSYPAAAVSGLKWVKPAYAAC